MKILLLTHCKLKNNATSNCLNNLIEKLPCDVTIYGISTPGAETSGENTNNTTEKINKSRKIQDRLISLLKNKLFKLPARWIIKFLNKTYIGLFLLTWRENSINNENIKKVRDLVEKNKYDCIISVCIPFECHYTAYAIKKQFKDIKWFAYYYDPYSFNAVNRSMFKTYNRMEYKVLKCADNIILTKKMYEEYSTCKLKKYLNKSIVCEFPNLKNRNIIEHNNTICFDKSFINCVFTGFLYPEIREPYFFLDILSKCSDNIKFYLVGGVAASMKSKIDEIKNNLKNKFEIIEHVPIDESFKIMNDADILINIGNLVNNQLPSKIFDYISTGKPIVNICKVYDCPTLEYIEKYPLRLNIFEKNGINNMGVSEFENFCNEMKNKKTPYLSIEKLYETSTPKYVANQIMELVTK